MRNNSIYPLAAFLETSNELVVIVKEIKELSSKIKKDTKKRQSLKLIIQKDEEELETLNARLSLMDEKKNEALNLLGAMFQPLMPMTLEDGPGSSMAMTVMSSPCRGGTGRNVDISFKIDLNKLLDQIIQLVKPEKREPGVRAVINKLNADLQGSANAMVFNLEADSEALFEHIWAFDQITIGGTLFGVWIFTKGSFWNKGDGGWMNWAYTFSEGKDHKEMNGQKIVWG